MGDMLKQKLTIIKKRLEKSLGKITASGGVGSDAFKLKLALAVLLVALVLVGCLPPKASSQKAITASTQAERASTATASASRAVLESTATLESSDTTKDSAQASDWAGAQEGTQTVMRQVIPVLLYHQILPNPTNSITTAPEVFDRQMKTLYDLGYKTITLDQLYANLTRGKPLPKKPVLITFDDGWKNQYQNAIPILLKYKFKAAFFVNPQTINFKNRIFMNTVDLVDLDKHGFDVQSHTWAHSNLIIKHGETSTAYRARLTHELKDSKVWLEHLLKKRMKYFAYPYGLYNSFVVKAVADTGYKMAFTVNSGKNMEGEQSPLLLKRTIIFRNTSFKNFINDLNSMPLDVTAHYPEDASYVATDTACIAAILGNLEGVNIATLRLRLDYHDIGGRVILSPDHKRVYSSGVAKLKPGYHYAVIRGRTNKGAIIQSSWSFFVRR
ncbi:MAG: polysaccharide deacetylase family protein [Candidatus Aquicultor sp.]